MLWISLPAELALPHLVELSDVARPLHDDLTGLSRALETGSLNGALTAAGRAFGRAKGLRDRYGQAIALLFQAEAYRRLERWEDALDAIRTALHWLELQVAAAARYNEAIAVYVEGVIHFTLGAQERMVETCSYAQHVLGESERHWAYEHNDPRAADCRNVTGWIGDLLKLRDTLPPSGLVAVLPVYVRVDGRLTRTGATAVEGIRATLPGDVLARYLPHDLQPAVLGECVFPSLLPPSRYVAIQISGSETESGSGTGERLVVVEVDSPALGISGPIPTPDTAMWYRDDGQTPGIPWARDIGVPRVLVRKGDEG
jgi:hypothetical protein